MSFATVIDLITRYGATELAQLADRAIPRVVTDAMLVAAANGDFSGLTSEQLTAVQRALDILAGALADASEVVKGYVATRYPGAVTVEPPLRTLTRLTCELTRFELYGQGAPDHVKDRAEKSRATLRDISSGSLTLGETAEESNTLAAGDGVEMQSSPVRFNRKTSTGFL